MVGQWARKLCNQRLKGSAVKLKTLTINASHCHEHTLMHPHACSTQTDRHTHIRIPKQFLYSGSKQTHSFIYSTHRQTHMHPHAGSTQTDRHTHIRTCTKAVPVQFEQTDTLMHVCSTHRQTHMYPHAGCTQTDRHTCTLMQAAHRQTDRQTHMHPHAGCTQTDRQTDTHAPLCRLHTDRQTDRHTCTLMQADAQTPSNTAVAVPMYVRIQCQEKQAHS